MFLPQHSLFIIKCTGITALFNNSWSSHTADQSSSLNVLGDVAIGKLS